MKHLVSAIPVIGLLTVVGILFDVAIRYVELRRKELRGPALEEFNTRTERVTLLVMLLVIGSVLSLAFSN